MGHPYPGQRKRARHPFGRRAGLLGLVGGLVGVVTDMAKVVLRDARYALTSFTTVGFAFSGS